MRLRAVVRSSNPSSISDQPPTMNTQTSITARHENLRAVAGSRLNHTPRRLSSRQPQTTTNLMAEHTYIPTSPALRRVGLRRGKLGWVRFWLKPSLYERDCEICDDGNGSS